MKLKVNFVSKISKTNTINELVFVKNKNIRQNNLKSILKVVLENELFNEKKFICSNGETVRRDK